MVVDLIRMIDPEMVRLSGQRERTVFFAVEDMTHIKQIRFTNAKLPLILATNASSGLLLKPSVLEQTSVLINTAHTEWLGDVYPRHADDACTH
jgi:hypothetical protein